MSELLFAAGYFGLPHDDGEYRVLGHSPDFPSAAVMALASLGRSFGWRPAGDGSAGTDRRFEDCIALWPAVDGVLVARLRDAGADEHGRPHSLAIDAAWLPDPAEPSLLAQCLSLAAWPLPTGDPASPLRLRPAPATDDLVERVRRNGRGPLLVAGHRNYYAPAFDNVANGVDSQSGCPG
ncbi:MAG TPA: hypothetical protein VH120_15180 [Gemmataceae bacterium]|nr:hypothetical protein [Gemmataceae bacterium]